MGIYYNSNSKSVSNHLRYLYNLETLPKYGGQSIGYFISNYNITERELISYLNNPDYLLPNDYFYESGYEREMAINKLSSLKYDFQKESVKINEELNKKIDDAREDVKLYEMYLATLKNTDERDYLLCFDFAVENFSTSKYNFYKEYFNDKLKSIS